MIDRRRAAGTRGDGGDKKVKGGLALKGERDRRTIGRMM